MGGRDRSRSPAISGGGRGGRPDPGAARNRDDDAETSGRGSRGDAGRPAGWGRDGRDDRREGLSYRQGERNDRGRDGRPSREGGGGQGDRDHRRSEASGRRGDYHPKGDQFRRGGAARDSLERGPRRDARGYGNGSPGGHRDSGRERLEDERGREGGPPGRRPARDGPREVRPGDDSGGEAEGPPPPSPQEPDFGLSGVLAKESNTVNGVVLLHQEPPEARRPSERWRLYVFKGGEPFGEPLRIHRQSRYLFGRDRKVADVPTDHPSCSKQHCVLQFRHVEREEDGELVHKTLPYLMDLGSVNGTWLNNERIEPARYYQLLQGDLFKCGTSTREYVILLDTSHGT